MIPLLIRVPFVAIAIFLLLKMKMFRAFSPKKKSISILVTILISLAIISAIPFDYYLFNFNTPAAAINYSMNQPKQFYVMGILNNSSTGDYVVTNTRNGYESYYLEKINQKWKMVKPNIKYNIKTTTLKFAMVTYKHYINEKIVAIELYYPFDSGTALNNQIKDNKGTTFQSISCMPNTAREKPILFCGLYSFDNLPYELYINGELVFSYSENSQ